MMKNFKQIVKENKKRALSIAVATVFSISGPVGLVGCYNTQNEEDEEEESSTNGSHISSGHSSGWNFFRSGSSQKISPSGDSSGSSGNSKITSGSDSGSSIHSGYSGTKGGSSSS